MKSIPVIDRESVIEILKNPGVYTLDQVASALKSILLLTGART